MCQGIGVPPEAATYGTAAPGTRALPHGEWWWTAVCAAI